MDSYHGKAICLVIFVHLFILFVSAQDCKKMTFVGLDNTKALVHHTYKSIPTDQEEFCSGLCYMDDRCISYAYDLEKKVCNLSNSDDVMHPQDMMDVPNTKYLRAETACNCKGNSFCAYLHEFKTFKCICKFGFAGDNCDKDLELVAVYPLTASHQARSLQSGPPAGNISNVECTDESNDKVQGYCQFAGVKSSYIEIPNQLNGRLDLKNSMTILLYINAEKDGPLFQYNSNAWGVHLFLLAPNYFFVRLMKRSNLASLANLQNAIPLGEWKFGGFTYDASTGINSLWIDGQKVQTRNVGIFEMATQFEIRLGATNFKQRHFGGKIACVQVYKRVLTAQEIQQARRLCRYLV